MVYNLLVYVGKIMSDKNVKDDTPATVKIECVDNDILVSNQVGVSCIKLTRNTWSKQ
jgi:hypothetical protein